MLIQRNIIFELFPLWIRTNGTGVLFKMSNYQSLSLSLNCTGPCVQWSIYQDIRKGGLSLRGGGLHDGFWRFWRFPSAVLESTLPSLRLSYKMQDKRHPWRFWRLWRFQSWRLPPWNSTPLSDILKIGLWPDPNFRGGPSQTMGKHHNLRRVRARL